MLEERAQIATSVERMGSLVVRVSTKCRARCAEVHEKMEFEAVGALVLAGQALRWPFQATGSCLSRDPDGAVQKYLLSLRGAHQVVARASAFHGGMAPAQCEVGCSGRPKLNWLLINSAVSDLEQGPVPEQVVVSSRFEVRV